MFAVIEGANGVGKSRIIRLVAELLNKEGVAVVLSREPGGTPWGEDARGMLMSPRMSPHAMPQLLMFNAIRSDHVLTLIKPRSEEPNTVVLVDRYILSSLVHQGEALSDSIVLDLHDQCINYNPDLTFLLEASPENIAERMSNRDPEYDRYEVEGLKAIEASSKRYSDGRKKLIDRYGINENNFPIINCDRPPQGIAEDVANQILKSFKRSQRAT